MTLAYLLYCTARLIAFLFLFLLMQAFNCHRSRKPLLWISFLEHVSLIREPWFCIIPIYMYWYLYFCHIFTLATKPSMATSSDKQQPKPSLFSNLTSSATPVQSITADKAKVDATPAVSPFSALHFSHQPNSDWLKIFKFSDTTKKQQIIKSRRRESNIMAKDIVRCTQAQWWSMHEWSRKRQQTDWLIYLFIKLFVTKVNGYTMKFCVYKICILVYIF